MAASQVTSATPDVPAAPGAVPGLTYKLDRVADGVYCAIAGGVPYYVSNSVVILGSEGVAVVDSGAGPGEARVLLDAIRKVTDLPVRYVVDTHFHFDHAFGSESFAGAIVVGHDATGDMLGPDALQMKTVAGYIAGLPAQIAKARAEAEKEADGQKRGDALGRAAALEAYQQELASFRPKAPTVTFADSLTLELGGREVRLLHVGRGHTAGDVVVHLPKERIVCTGDLYNGYIGFMGDAYVDEWAETLERLKALEFDTVIPGHGSPFTGKDGIAPVQACLRDLWRQVEVLRHQGLIPEEAARRVDLRAHAPRFPRFTAVGFETVAVSRMYEVMNERPVAASAR